MFVSPELVEAVKGTPLESVPEGNVIPETARQMDDWIAWGKKIAGLRRCDPERGLTVISLARFILQDLEDAGEVGAALTLIERWKSR